MFNSKNHHPNTNSNSNNSNSTDNDDNAYEYTTVRLVNDRSIDLYVYHSRGKGIWRRNDDKWLEEGRPRELSALTLSTWSLLSTSIRDYQTGLQQYLGRLLTRMLLPLYVVWFGSLFLVNLEFVLGYYLILLLALSLIIIVSSYYKQKYVDEVFNPAVATVVEELATKLLEAGFEVQFMVETGEWFKRPSRSFLRFNPIEDEEQKVVS